MAGRKKKEHTQEPAQDAMQTIQEAQEQSQAVQTDQETQQGAREQSQAVQTAPEAQQGAREQSQVIQAAPEAPEGAQEGINLENTALAGSSDDIVVVNTAGGLNLRIGPGRSYPVAELLEDGTLLAVLELPHGAEVPGWALVHTGQRTGWVDRSFIQELEEAKEE